MKECILLLKDITLHKIKYNFVWKIRKQLETYLLGRGCDRVKYLPDIAARLEGGGEERV